MSKQTDYDQLKILGVEVDAISNSDAIDYILDLAAPGRPAAYVVKPYVEFLEYARGDADVRPILNQAALCLPDGVALTWAAAYLYAGKRTFGRFVTTLSQIILAPDRLRWPLPDRAAGINFTWPLLQAAAERHLSVYLVGSPANSSIGHTADVLRHGIKSLKIVGTHTGRDETRPPGEVSEQWQRDLAAAVTAAKPDLILVGMGFPLQERVCAYLAEFVDHGVFIGEGGTFDYEKFGGARPKAPERMQRLGLEWLWRLIQDPSRWRRQLAIPRFIYHVWRSR
jgi:N-acetylglucosaminyldiphosphoundecaprenol N-acetyl-beta-D-mannosaminyltransferase